MYISLPKVIDFCVENKRTKKDVKPQMTQITGQCIPLRLVLKKFFELPDVFKSTLQYMQEVQSESQFLILYNVKDGEM